jgi:hypothetical protein
MLGGDRAVNQDLTAGQAAFWVCAFAVGLVGYFLPSIVARAREHRQMIAIAVLNAFLGWTVLGWVVALVWACVAQPEPATGAPVAFRETPAPSGGPGGYEPPRSARSATPAAVHRWGAVITGLLVVVGIMLGLALR